MSATTHNHLSSETSWRDRFAIGAKQLRPTVRGLRLASGLILLTFVVTHLANHALGLVSLATMEFDRLAFPAVWRHPLVTGLMIGAVLVHLALALHAIYARRRLRMPPAEAAQLLLGLAIPPLLLIHILGMRGLHQIYGLDDTYS